MIVIILEYYEIIIRILSARRPDLIIINKKRENLPNCVSADHRIKLIETEKNYKYQNFAKKLK